MAPVTLFLAMNGAMSQLPAVTEGRVKPASRRSPSSPSWISMGPRRLASSRSGRGLKQRDRDLAGGEAFANVSDQQIDNGSAAQCSRHFLAKDGQPADQVEIRTDGGRLRLRRGCCSRRSAHDPCEYAGPPDRGRPAVG